MILTLDRIPQKRSCDWHLHDMLKFLSFVNQKSFDSTSDKFSTRLFMTLVKPTCTHMTYFKVTYNSSKIYLRNYLM